MHRLRVHFLIWPPRAQSNPDLLYGDGLGRGCTGNTFHAACLWGTPAATHPGRTANDEPAGARFERGLFMTWDQGLTTEVRCDIYPLTERVGKWFY